MSLEHTSYTRSENFRRIPYGADTHIIGKVSQIGQHTIDIYNFVYLQPPRLPADITVKSITSKAQATNG